MVERRDLRSAVGVLAGVILIVAVTALSVATGQPMSGAGGRSSQASVTTATLVCPYVARQGQNLNTELTIADPAAPASLAATTVRAGLLQGRTTALRPISTKQIWAYNVLRGGGPYEIQAAGPAAGRVVAAQSALVNHKLGRGLNAATCDRPQADWWFEGLDGRVGYADAIQLANPADSPAAARVTLFSSQAHVNAAPSLQSVAIPAHSAVTLSIAKVAPDVPDIAAHVHATNGLVVASAMDSRIHGVDPQGSDRLPANRPPARHVVLAGFPAQTGLRQLYITDVGRAAATVTLQVVSTGGTFAPNGKARIDVPAGTTSTLQLTRALHGAAATVRLTSDHPIVAGAVVGASARHELPEISWRAGTLPLAAGDVFAQDYAGAGRSNQLILSSIGTSGTVSVQAGSHRTTLQVPAGRSKAFDIDGLLHSGSHGLDAITVTGVSGGPIFGELSTSLAGAHGPLLTALPASPPARSVRVPPVGIDPAGAISP